MTLPTQADYDRVSAVATQRSSNPLARYCFALLTAVVLMGAIALAAGNLLSIGFVYEKNYNEGWNVYNTERLIDHETIYDDNYWRVNNYPIGSFLIVAGVNFLLHDLLLSGRLVALVSFAAIGALAAAATRRFGGDRIDAVFGAGCALGFCYLMAPAWVAVDDPQTLGEAVMLGGLVSYISKPPDRLSLLRTALLVVLGGFIKHNLVAVPLAVTLDLALRWPRLLRFWLSCCAGLAAGFLGLTDLVAGGAFIDHLLSPRLFTWDSARYHLMKYLRFFKFPAIVIVLFAPIIFTGNRFVLAACGIIALAAAMIFSGFEGTSYNTFQDAAVLLAIAAGVALHELRKAVALRGVIDDGFAQVALGAAALLLAQPILARSPEAFDQLYHIDHIGDLLATQRRAETAFSAEVQYVSERPGPAICESLLLCYRAGRAFTLDPFNSRQYILTGRLDQDQLIRRIAAREFAVIQVRSDICEDATTADCHILHYPRQFNRFTDEVLYAVSRSYRIGLRSQDGTFYIPK